MFARTRTVSLNGAVGHVIEVQVDIGRGTVRTVLVGRPDLAINEARERCRAAVDNSGYEWPDSRRTTILLSPADLPKRGPHFDLAIALAVVVAHDKEFPREALEGLVVIGELCLDGRVRCVPGVLPMVMAAVAAGVRRVVVPEPQVAEAALVDGVEVYGVRSLRQVVAVVRGDEEIPVAPEVEPFTGDSFLAWRGQERLEDVDLVDVLGMADARYALEVAAAGGHHLMLTGPRGAGKTTLAERLPTILPDLDREQALELTAIHSLCGGLPPGVPVITKAPFRAPHHTASRAGILGGGSGRVHPGEVSKAHHGVLFLDEFPLLPSDVIDALRQPLESGQITISRGDDEATYPAGGMLLLASNPCPCGDYSPYSRDHQCKCSEVRRREYRRKLSGPIADRIDITRFVAPLRQQDHDPTRKPENSEAVRTRVIAARDRQRARYAEDGWRLNAQVPGPALRVRWPMTEEATRQLDAEVYAATLTIRGATRVHRVAWTVADLRGVEQPGHVELDIALSLRRAAPLDLRALETGPVW